MRCRSAYSENRMNRAALCFRNACAAGVCAGVCFALFVSVLPAPGATAPRQGMLPRNVDGFSLDDRLGKFQKAWDVEPEPDPDSVKGLRSLTVEGNDPEATVLRRKAWFDGDKCYAIDVSYATSTETPARILLFTDTLAQMGGKAVTLREADGSIRKRLLDGPTLWTVQIGPLEGGSGPARVILADWRRLVSVLERVSKATRKERAAKEGQADGAERKRSELFDLR